MEKNEEKGKKGPSKGDEEEGENKTYGIGRKQSTS